jgi:hypothetical protein
MPKAGRQVRDKLREEYSYRENILDSSVAALPQNDKSKETANTGLFLYQEFLSRFKPTTPVPPLIRGTKTF